MLQHYTNSIVLKHLINFALRDVAVAWNLFMGSGLSALTQSLPLLYIIIGMAGDKCGNQKRLLCIHTNSLHTYTWV